MKKSWKIQRIAYFAVAFLLCFSCTNASRNPASRLEDCSSLTKSGAQNLSTSELVNEYFSNPEEACKVALLVELRQKIFTFGASKSAHFSANYLSELNILKESILPYSENEAHQADLISLVHFLQEYYVNLNIDFLTTQFSENENKRATIRAVLISSVVIPLWMSRGALPKEIGGNITRVWPVFRQFAMRMATPKKHLSDSEYKYYLLQKKNNTNSSGRILSFSEDYYPSPLEVFVGVQGFDESNYKGANREADHKYSVELKTLWTTIAGAVGLEAGITWGGRVLFGVGMGSGAGLVAFAGSFVVEKAARKKYDEYKYNEMITEIETLLVKNKKAKNRFEAFQLARELLKNINGLYAVNSGQIWRKYIQTINTYAQQSVCFSLRVPSTHLTLQDDGVFPNDIQFRESFMKIKERFLQRKHSNFHRELNLIRNEFLLRTQSTIDLMNKAYSLLEKSEVAGLFNVEIELLQSSRWKLENSLSVDQLEELVSREITEDYANSFVAKQNKAIALYNDIKSKYGCEGSPFEKIEF